MTSARTLSRRKINSITQELPLFFRLNRHQEAQLNDDFKMSHQITEGAKVDYQAGAHLAGVGDVKADEANYLYQV